MKTLLKPLAKNVLSATDAAIHKKMFGFYRPLDLTLRTTTLIFPNEEMNDIIWIIKYLE